MLLVMRFKPVGFAGDRYRQFTTKILNNRFDVEAAQQKFFESCLNRGTEPLSVKIWASNYPYFPEVWASLVQNDALSYREKFDSLRRGIPDLDVKTLFITPEHREHLKQKTDAYRANKYKSVSELVSANG